jgi:hypothetical protein
MYINAWTANKYQQLTHISSSFNSSNHVRCYKYHSSIYLPTNQSVNKYANPPINTAAFQLTSFVEVSFSLSLSLLLGLLTGHTWPYCIPRAIFYSDVFPSCWNSTNVSLRQTRSLGVKDLQPSNAESRKWIGKRRQKLKVTAESLTKRQGKVLK